LAREAVVEGTVPSISARTVRRILHEVDLQPHRTRYWKTAHLDAHFKQRTEKILWCYANAQRLVHSGFWIVCVDEMPNRQALEPTPSGGLSPARSSSRSLSIPATAPSMCCCF
jgi:hypothetical protein